MYKFNYTEHVQSKVKNHIYLLVGGAAKDSWICLLSTGLPDSLLPFLKPDLLVSILVPLGGGGGGKVTSCSLTAAGQPC